MERTAEIVGGVNIGDIAEGGAIFDVKYQPEDNESEEVECQEMLQTYLKLECIGDSYNGEEPFESIAQQMTNLLDNGKIKKKILRDGYGEKPQPSSNLNIHYNAYVQYEAQPFDSTYARKKAFSFKTGVGDVIEGLEIAVLSMKINEKSQFLIDPELAYRNGGLVRIPPNATILFEIELYDFQQVRNVENEEINSKTFEVVYPACLALSVKGKKMVKLQDYSGAIKQYKTAIKKLEDAVLRDYEDQTKSEELLVRLYTNTLICCTLANIPKFGCVCAQKILEMARNETFSVGAKVYYNHAKCLRMLGNFELAKKKLLCANNLEPNNPEIKQEFIALQTSRDEHQKLQQKMGRALLDSY